MAGEWEYLSLEEAGVELFDCVHKTPPAVEAGYPYIAIPQMKGGESISRPILDGSLGRISSVGP